MKVTHGLQQHQRAPYPLMTIGNFDGLHQGHVMLLEQVVKAARERNGWSILLTFEPHPAKVLAATQDLRLLMSLEEKLAACSAIGIDEVILVHFRLAFASLSPEAFIEQVLGQAIGVRELFVGERFSFGRGRAGGLDDLRRLGEGIGCVVHALPPLSLDGQVVSSTVIRRLLQAGKVRQAARLLGRPYTLGGSVQAGSQRGAALGWRTANLSLPPERVIPADGIYAALTMCRGQRFPSAAYIGTRPTFGTGERLLEVHLLDVHVDLYDEEIQVRFIEYVREDKTFSSSQQLSAQIDQDVHTAREILRAEAAS